MKIQQECSARSTKAWCKLKKRMAGIGVTIVQRAQENVDRMQRIVVISSQCSDYMTAEEQSDTLREPK